MLVYVLYPVLSPKFYLKLMMFGLLGYWPNLKNPGTFNEKTAYLKLYPPQPLASIAADKWRVRDYVSQKGLSEILNQVYWYGNNPQAIPFDELPAQFVIKANHGSGWNIFVADKNNIDRDAIIAKCNYWLNTKYGKKGRWYESFYDNIEPLIIIEKFLEDKSGDLSDYKFFCYDGKPKFVQVSFDRYTNHTRTYFDEEWNVIPMSLGNPRGKIIPKPICYDRMLQAAKRLSSDFNFVRVDLYEFNQAQVIFSELTLTHGGGFERFYPKEWDYKFGEYWKIG